MAGTMDDPFVESAADCNVCLDLKQKFLKRQWRKFGRLPALSVPYAFTCKLLSDSAESAKCEGCILVHSAAQKVREEFDLDFRNVILEYVDKGGQEGLSLTLTMLHPLHTRPGDWEKAQDDPNLRTSVHAGPSTETSKRQWVHRISSPQYEIFMAREISNDLTDDAASSLAALQLADAEAEAEDKPQAWDAILPRPSRCGDTGSDEAIEWTLACHKSCSSTHSQCNLRESGWALPTRILDVGEGIVGDHTPDAKLYVSRGEQASYLCLSHCWGTDRERLPLVTTHDRLEEFQDRIPWEALTKTFQNAISFTRKLGYRYLWIDSLCIVQDDKEDWLREAGRMASIYEDADLTLAAASSDHSDGGLFRASTPELQLLQNERNGGAICLRRFSDPAFFHPDAKSKSSPTDPLSPLLKRAWVFQERMLSRRVLFFTPQELVFECRCSNRTESGFPWADSTAKHHFESAYAEKYIGHSLVGLWHDLVNDYTKLQLTNKEDTLPAMAGLAKKVRQLKDVTKSGYFDGLWKDTFIEDMLWETRATKRGDEIRTNHVIPTWSWARTREPKEYSNVKEVLPLCSLQDVTLSPVDHLDDLLTTARSGYAMLSGYLLRARGTSSGVAIDQNPRVRHIPSRDYDWFKEGPDKVNDGDELFVLPLAVSRSGDEDGDGTVHCLVLRRCDDDSETFTRVGIFRPSIHHLKHHEYIFEGHDILLAAYKNDVAYGESLLGEDGVYVDKDGHSSKPLSMTSDSGRAYSQFRMRANYLQLVLLGNQPDSEREKFNGTPHLEALKNMIAAEEERIEDWNGRHKRGGLQQHQRVSIKIA